MGRATDAWVSVCNVSDQHRSRDRTPIRRLWRSHCLARIDRSCDLSIFVSRYAFWIAIWRLAWTRPLEAGGVVATDLDGTQRAIGTAVITLMDWSGVADCESLKRRITAPGRCVISQNWAFFPFNLSFCLVFSV